MEALISHLPHIPFYSKLGEYQPSPPPGLLAIWIGGDSSQRTLRMDLAGKGLDSANRGFETKIQTDEGNHITSESSTSLHILPCRPPHGGTLSESPPSSFPLNESVKNAKFPYHLLGQVNPMWWSFKKRDIWISSSWVNDHHPPPQACTSEIMNTIHFLPKSPPLFSGSEMKPHGLTRGRYLFWRFI